MAAQRFGYRRVNWLVSSVSASVEGDKHVTVTSQPRRILAAMRDRWTVLIVADDLSDCRGLVRVLSNQPALEVVRPLPALEALRFCSTAIPVVVLLHKQLKDISAAELCALIRRRANGTRVSYLLFGPADSDSLRVCRGLHRSRFEERLGPDRDTGLTDC